MRLLTVNAASKEPGAPSQQRLDKLSKRPRPPAFVVASEEGLRIDADSPAWASYVSKSKGKSIGGKAGARVRVRKAACTADYSGEAVARAVDQKLVEDGRRAKYEADLAEIKALAATGKYIEKGTVFYYLSFIQRGAQDAFAAVKRAMPEVIRLIKADDVKGAEKLIVSMAAGAFGTAIKMAIAELQKEDGED